MHSLWYRFKCWAWHRYTTVKPRSMPWNTWTDRGDLLPHVMFEVFSRFIEGECSPGCIDWNHDDEHRRVRAEMQRLYDWWHKRFLKLDGRHNEEWAAFCAEHSTHVTKECEMKHAVELITAWDTPENEEHAEYLYQEAAKNEKQLEQELNANCKAMIDLIPYMWT